MGSGLARRRDGSLISGYDSRSSTHAISGPDQQLQTLLLRYHQLRAGTDLDHAERLAPTACFDRRDPTNDPTRNGSSDLADTHAAVWSARLLQSQFEPFILAMRTRQQRIEKLARPISLAQHQNIGR